MSPRAPLLLLLLAACQTDPVSGGSYYSPLGNDFASQDKYVRENFLTQLLVTREGGLLYEPEVVAACKEAFEKVVAAVPPDHRRGFQYHLLLTVSPDVNAYTYGAGRIHCHLGLLARCKDEAEFLGVMAHEIGHNSHDHFGKSLGRQSIGGTFANIGWIAGPPGRKLTEGLSGIVAVQFTRGQEREADDLAVDYARAAGIDPDGLARFFEAMHRDFGDEGAEFFKTHPDPENRVKAIRARIAKVGGAGGETTTPAFDAALARAREVLPYYEKMAEAASGDDPKQWLEAAEKGALALPRHATFHFWRGAALEAEGEHEAALTSLRTATRLNLGNFFVPLVWGALEFKAQHWAATEEAADALLEIVPMPSAFFLRGVARVKQGKDAEGRRDLEFLLSLFPEKDRAALVTEIQKHVPDFDGSQVNR